MAFLVLVIIRADTLYQRHNQPTHLPKQLVWGQKDDLPDKHVHEVDEGELYESCEHGNEANDDKYVQSCSITNLISSV